MTLQTAAFSPSPASILRLQSAARCLFLSPGALNFEPMGIDTAEFIRWALESREETLKDVWMTGEILSPRALKKHITAKLDLLDRLDMLKTEGDA